MKSPGERGSPFQSLSRLHPAALPSGSRLSALRAGTSLLPAAAWRGPELVSGGGLFIFTTEVYLWRVTLIFHSQEPGIVSFKTMRLCVRKWIKDEPEMTPTNQVQVGKPPGPSRGAQTGTRETAQVVAGGAAVRTGSTFQPRCLGVDPCIRQRGRVSLSQVASCTPLREPGLGLPFSPEVPPRAGSASASSGVFHTSPPRSPRGCRLPALGLMSPCGLGTNAEVPCQSGVGRGVEPTGRAHHSPLVDSRRRNLRSHTALCSSPGNRDSGPDESAGC